MTLTEQHAADPDLDVDPDVDEPDEPAFDPLDDLTLAELDAGSRALKASLIVAVTRQTADYERGLAVVCWLHARRADRTATVGAFMGMRFSELTDVLAGLGPTPTDPSTPGPA